MSTSSVPLGRQTRRPEMCKAGGGAIVNLGSISSFIAQPKFVTYNATKAAIANMTRCMALDLAPDKIRVNAVCPGVVWTQIVERLTREEGMDRAAADAHPVGVAQACSSDAPTARDRLRHPLPLLGRSLVHHRDEPDGRRGLHGGLTRPPMSRAGHEEARS